MRLIDADKLETHEQLEPFGNGNYEYVEIVYKDDIDDAPTIEPNRKKGKLKTIGFLTCQCSECGAQFHELEYTSFCPNCGVKWGE